MHALQCNRRCELRAAAVDVIDAAAAAAEAAWKQNAARAVPVYTGRRAGNS